MKEQATPELAALQKELDELIEKLPAAREDDSAILFETEANNPFIEKLSRYRKGNLDKTPIVEPSALESGVSMILESALRAKDLINKEVSRIPMQRHTAKHSVYYRLGEAKDYIDLHFTEEIDLGEIASVACLSQYHFIRLFKSVFEITPYQYVLLRRLEKAAELLRETDTSIGDICMMVGIEGLAQFSDAFKKQFGVAPSKYRTACAKF